MSQGRLAFSLAALISTTALCKGRLEVKFFPKSPVAGRDVVVEVYVLDALTGEPVEGAVVELRSPPSMGVEVEGRTRRDGRARLPLPAKRGGPLDVEVSAVGHEPVSLRALVRFGRLPPSAPALLVLYLLAFWGGAVLALLGALRSASRRGPPAGGGPTPHSPS